MSQSYIDIDSLSRSFHNAAVMAARVINPRMEDYIVNEIKVQTLNVCTAILVITAVASFFRGSIPFTLVSIVFNGGALLGRMVVERSMNPKFYERPEDFIKSLEPTNTPIPNMKGWGIFYLSPWLKEQLGKILSK